MLTSPGGQWEHLGDQAEGQDRAADSREREGGPEAAGLAAASDGPDEGAGERRERREGHRTIPDVAGRTRADREVDQGRERQEQAQEDVPAGLRRSRRSLRLPDLDIELC